MILGGAVAVFIGLTAAVYYIVFVAAAKPKTVLPLEDFIECPLLKKEILSHDTVRFTFGLPQENAVLGLPTGQHINLRFTDPTTKQTHQRSYTPVSYSDRQGDFSVVIKIYKPNPPKFPNGGIMSQHLDSLQIGDTILMKGPKGHLHYHVNGQFSVKPLGKPLVDRKCQQICMMAGGTGITPMLQILHAIFHNPQDTKIKMNLIYANQTEDDILVREELEALQRDYPDRFHLWYTIDRCTTASSNGTSNGFISNGHSNGHTSNGHASNGHASNGTKQWSYDIGFISKEMIQKHLLFPNMSIPTQFFMCGPPPMIKFACIPALQELGYSDQDWVVF